MTGTFIEIAYNMRFNTEQSLHDNVFDLSENEFKVDILLLIGLP